VRTGTVGKVKPRRAFTLIEMTVVGVILLTLVSMSFVGFRAIDRRATGNRAKTELTQLTASLQGYYDARGYYPTDQTTLAKIEPGLVFQTSTITKQGVVSIAVGSSGGMDVLGVAQLDSSNQCVALRVTPNLTPSRASVVIDAPSGGCSGTYALSITGSSW
jgi:Tfp pilus assembly protein PilE